jgi:hypothetical protein
MWTLFQILETGLVRPTYIITLTEGNDDATSNSNAIQLNVFLWWIKPQLRIRKKRISRIRNWQILFNRI